MGHINADSVVISNSRNYYSLDPSKLKNNGIYNLSLTGITIDQIYKLFRHAVSIAPIKEAYIGLDSICVEATGSDSIDERFLATNYWHIDLYLKKFLFTISSQATLETFNTIRGKATSGLDAYGRQTVFNEFDFKNKGHSFALDGRDAVKINAERKIAEDLSSYSTFKKTCDITPLNKILDLAHERNVHLTFFINPVNMRYWEIQYRLGTFDRYYYLKRIALEAIENFAQRNNEVPPKIYDFNVASNITTEPLSANAPTEPTYWYESSHHKMIVGDMMVEALKTKTGNISSPYYSILSLDNLDKNFKSNKEAFLKWRSGNKGILKEIDTLMEKNQ